MLKNSNNWALQDAKSRLSELVKKAKIKPQFISVRGEPAVVVLSQKEYFALKKPSISFYEFLRKSPLVGLDLDITRDKSPNRDVEL